MMVLEPGIGVLSCTVVVRVKIPQGDRVVPVSGVEDDGMVS